MPDETVWRTMLFDFYGDLLTDKQREYYDLHYNQDLSLAEIAAQQRHFASGRVGQHPPRGRRAARYGGRLGLVRRFAAHVQPRPRWRIRLTKLRDTVGGDAGLWLSGRCGSFRI